MKNQALYEKLTPVFREVFDDNSLVPCPEMTAADVKNWDSLSNIRLIISIEEALDIHFDTAEITQLANVGELVDVIEAKLSK